MSFDCGFKRENNWFRYRAAAIIVEEGCVLFAGNEIDDYLYSIGGGVHMNETSEAAVVREVFEETGVHYEVDRLAVIHENLFEGDGGTLGENHCHEVAFYYLMKPRGSRELHSDSYTCGVREQMHWIPLEDLDKHRAFPTFLKEYLQEMPEGIVHIVTDERERRTDYRQVQKIAKDTMEYARKHIKPGMNLLEIRKMCEDKMLELGADSFWYWDVGAFVFAGEETAVSVSGTKYVTSDRIINLDDIVTIDLSPQKDNIWGDFARTIILQNGVVVELDDITHAEWKDGLQMEEFLHKELFRFATPRTTFEELYYHMNHLIEEKGFINLDFMGNLGHSIVKEKKDRIYIEKGNTCCLGDVDYFTFEPHISVCGSKYGYKKENIYYFDGERLAQL